MTTDRPIPECTCTWTLQRTRPNRNYRRVTRVRDPNCPRHAQPYIYSDNLPQETP